MKYELQGEVECAFCHKETRSWEPHELAPDLWKIICTDCVLTTGLDEGK